MTAPQTDAERWMLRALELAERGRGTTSPNPMVGAVLIQDGHVVGEGFHARAGDAHAERHALQQAGDAARGADLYGTLEPCCYTGRTGPCTEALIEAGVGRVFVGAIDPNPRVAGQGLARLRQAGIEVLEGVLTDRCTSLNEVFNHWVTTGRPWVTAKLATTLDGRIAAANGSSRWITGEEARAEVHRLRAESDAVLVGIGTALVDDPRLTVRDASPLGRPALRVVVDSELRLPTSARMLEEAPGIPVLVATANEDPARRQALEDAGARVAVLPRGEGGVDLHELMALLGCLDPEPVTSLLVEGGGVLVGQLMAQGLLCRMHLHMAPGFMDADAVPAIGHLGLEAPAQMPRLKLERVGRLGDDVVIVGRLAPHSAPDEPGA